MNGKKYEFYESLWQEDFNFEFTAACRKDRFDEVRFVLNHPTYKHRVQFFYNDYECLTDAASRGNNQIVEYLTSSPELKQHIDIQVADNYAIKVACKNGNLDLLKYILTDPNLKNRPSIHISDDLPFKLACDNGRLDIVKYLIFERNIEKTAAIIQFFEKNSHNPFVSEVISLFEKKDLAVQLEEDLSSDKTTSKKLKL